MFIDLTAADGFTLSAWRAEPTGRPRGTLIVLQEIFGVNSHIRQVADRFAADGFLAIAPAMFDRVHRALDLGYTPDDVAAGRALIPQVDWPHALLDIQAAFDHVQHAGKVGAVGYCWGGTAAWMAACRIPGLAAAVCYYGRGIVDNVAEQPRCPVQFHWGETDASIPLADVQTVTAAHPAAQSFIYPAGHGFNCDQRGAFDAASAAQARARTLAFLGEHLG
jgi:carboxymethylenebutenolidase